MGCKMASLISMVIVAVIFAFHNEEATAFPSESQQLQILNEARMKPAAPEFQEKVSSINSSGRRFQRKPRIRDGTLLFARSSMPYIGRINTCFHPLGRFTCVLCAGVLLNKRWFLTAAHCVAMPLSNDKSFKVKSIQVTLGDMNKDNTTEQGTLIVAGDIENIKVADNFDKQFRNNDIALVKLATDVQESQGVVQYMKLPAQGVTLAEGASVVYYGWGFYNPEEYLLSSQLRTGTAIVVKSETCNAHDASSQFCTMSKATVCFGDAGGPVVLQNAPGTVIGIISYNTPTCPPGVGQYRHTLVSAYVDWINGIIINTE